VDRREFLVGATSALVTRAARAQATPDLKPILAEVNKRHSESLTRIQEWIRQPTIAAENKGIDEGCELMMHLLRDAGCDQVVKCPTDLHPGVFGTWDAGAARTLAVYLM
jgi:hypothetical protein